MRGLVILISGAVFSLALTAGSGQAWAWPSEPALQGQDGTAQDATASSAWSSSSSSSSSAATAKPTTVVVVAPRVATPEHPTAALSPRMRAWLFTNGGGGAAKDCTQLATDLILANGNTDDLDPGAMACLSGNPGHGHGPWAGRVEIQVTDYDYRFGMDALKAKDYAKAMKLFTMVYNKGLPAGGIMIAKMHFYGLGVPQSTPQAISWFQKVLDDARNQPQPPPYDHSAPEALTPYAEAAVSLGQIYKDGLGIAKDLPKARHYYEQGDFLGAIPATYALGVLWEQGIGGEKNVARGLGYIKKAAEVGYPAAEYELGSDYVYGLNGVAQDKPKGLSYWLDAAAQKDADALYSVGDVYDQGDAGIKIAPDHAKALVYYKDAALQGQPEAENALGVAFYLGDGVPKNWGTARGLFKLAADQEEPDAMFNLAVMDAKGEGGDRDMASAYALFVLAHRLGLDKAEAAAKEIEPKLTAADHAKAEQMLAGVAH